jgi:hypothetical protein
VGSDHLVSRRALPLWAADAAATRGHASATLADITDQRHLDIGSHMNLLLAFLVSVGSPAQAPHGASGLDDFKAAYCYAHFSMRAQNAEASAEVREEGQRYAALIFPRYQAALERSKGTLLATGLQMEGEKARSASERLSPAEFFMVLEACKGFATQSKTP